MLGAMDPQLSKVEALAEPGCYSLTFTLVSGEERAVVARLREGAVVIPATAFTGWSVDSATFGATVQAVQAVHAARELARPQGVRLLDVDGGWDVSLGNIVLDETGAPACVSHGPMAAADGGRFRCADCGAAATFG
jgi:hypothetical protein